MSTLPSSEVKSLSRVRLFATPWTVAGQAPPSMGFSRQEYWSGLPFPRGNLIRQDVLSLSIWTFCCDFLRSIYWLHSYVINTLITL